MVSPTISSAALPRLKTASPRPLYSVRAPATISVCASGASKGGISSFPMSPTTATTKPMGWVSSSQCPRAYSAMLPICQLPAAMAAAENKSPNEIDGRSLHRALQDRVFPVQQDYKYYPQFGNISLISNFNHNTYHSGSLRLERRLHNGFTMTSFYTYAKNLSGADNEGGGGITYYNRSLEKARTSYDVRHHFNVQVTYDLPFGKGRRWLSQAGVLDYALGGWGLSINDTLDSGMPSSVGFSGSPNKYLTGTRIVPLTK